jgi:hypothetical protein
LRVPSTHRGHRGRSGQAILTKIMKKMVGVMILIIIMLGVLMPTLARAESGLSLVSGVGERCMQCGNCTVCDVLRVGFNLAKIIFGMAVGIALMFITWNVVGLVLNWGSEEGIAGAKKGITQSLMALLVISIIWFLVNALIITFAGTNSLTEGRAWFVGPKCMVPADPCT